MIRGNGGLNSSEDSIIDDDILIVRGKRPKRRRRPSSPVNLRPPKSDGTYTSSSSDSYNANEDNQVPAQEILENRVRVPSSAPTRFLEALYSLRTVLDSLKRSSDPVTPCLIHQDTPTGPSDSSSRPFKLETIVGETSKSGIRQAADKKNADKSKSSYNYNKRSSERRRQTGGSAVNPSGLRGITTGRLSQQDETEEAKERKKTLEIMKSRISTASTILERGSWSVNIFRRSTPTPTPFPEQSEEQDVISQPSSIAPPSAEESTITIVPPRKKSVRKSKTTSSIRKSAPPAPSTASLLPIFDPPSPTDDDSQKRSDSLFSSFGSSRSPFDFDSFQFSMRSDSSASIQSMQTGQRTTDFTADTAEVEVKAEKEPSVEHVQAAEFKDSEENKRPPLPPTTNNNTNPFAAALAKVKTFFTHWNPEAANNFRDSVEISSDEDQNLTTIEDEEDQRDSEWLNLSDHYNLDEFSGRERVKEDAAAGVRRSNGHGIPRRQFAMMHLQEVLPIYSALLFLGRFPFEIDYTQEIPQFKLKKMSGRYVIFVGTSMLAFLAAIFMVSNLLFISTIPLPHTFHENILHLEVNKFWVEGVLEVLNMVFVAASSFCFVVSSGRFYMIDFLNRWLLSISIIRYDVTRNLRRFVRIFFLIYGTYAVVFICWFFVGGENDNFPTARGMSGFLGILTFNNFLSEIRLRPSFRAAEYFGLVAHLYNMLVGRLLIVFIILHCLALENAAKRFNHRLAGCLRGVDFRNGTIASDQDVPYSPRVIVPYKRLFAEHLVITSFPRHITTVFYVVFIFYVCCKMAEMIVTLYSVGEPWINGYAESNQTYFNVSVQSFFKADSVVPILMIEQNYIYTMKCIFYVVKTWIPWFIFMEIIARPGAALMRGANLVVRKSYLHCKTKHALRFITSIKFSFGHRVTLGIHPGFEINKSFILKCVGFAIGIFVTVIQFTPAMINSKGILVCDHLGACYYFQFPAKLGPHMGLRMQVDLQEKSLENLEQKSTELITEEKALGFRYPPCNPPKRLYGRLPYEPVDFAFKCSFGNQVVYLPAYFEKQPAPIDQFVKVQPNSGEHSCEKSYELSELQGRKDLFDCYGSNLTESKIKLDECGNPKLVTPGFNRSKTLAVIRAVRFESGSIFCCYIYGGLLKEQGKRCNLLSTEASEEHHCQRNPNSRADRQQHEEAISKAWNESGASEPQQRLWTECLCQGMDDIVSHHPSACQAGKNANPPTPSPETPRNCPDTPAPELSCTNSSNDTKIYKDFYLFKCPGPASNATHILPTVLSFKYDSVVPVPFGHSCEKQSTVVNFTGVIGKFYDCYGRFTFIQRNRGWNVDDCGTRRLPFPSSKDGSMKWPEAKVVLHNDTTGRSGDALFSYSCCWDYEELIGTASLECNLYPGSNRRNVCSIRSAKYYSDATRICTNSSGTMYFLRGGQFNELYAGKCLDKLGNPLKTCKN